jgi:hypothetical protein
MALVAILVGQFVVAKVYITKYGASDIAEMRYEFEVESAREAAELRTDEDIKDFIADWESTGFKPVTTEMITAQRVAEFKGEELPRLRMLASGELTKKAFVEEESKAFLATLSVNDIFTASITPYLFFWVFVGVGAAWKLASDYGTSVE